MRNIRLFISLICLLAITAPNSPATAQSQPFALLSQIGRGEILDVMWRPNGDIILAATVTGAWIYSADLRDLGHIDGFDLASYSPRGRYISGVDQDNIIRLYDADTLRPVFSLDTTRDRVRSLAWSPKGDLLAELDHAGDLRIWNVVSRSLAFTSRDNDFTSIAWSKAGTYLAAASTHLWVWEIAAFEQIFPTEEYASSIYNGHLNWHGDRYLSVLVSGGDWEATERWDVAQQKHLDPDYDTKFGAEADCYARCSPDYQSIVNEVSIQTINPRAAASEIPVDDGAGLDIAWRADSLSVAVGVMTGESSAAGSGTITIVDITTGKITNQLNAHRGTIRSLRWNDDQQRLLSLGNDGYLRTWQTADSQLLGETRAHGMFTPMMAWRSDNSWLAVVSAENEVSLWLAPQISISIPLNSDYRYRAVRSLHWQPDGNLLAVHYDNTWGIVNGRREETSNGIVEIWDASRLLEAPTRLATITAPESFADVAWESTGQRLAIIGEDNYFGIWDAESRKITVRSPITTEGDEDSLNVDARWNHDSTMIAIRIGSFENVGYRIIDATDGSTIMRIDPLRDEKYGSVAYHTAYAWTPTGEFVHAAWNSVCHGGPCYWNGVTVGIVSPTTQQATQTILGALPTAEDIMQQAFYDYANYFFSPDGTQLIGTATAGSGEYPAYKVVFSGGTLWTLPTADTPQFTEQHSIPNTAPIVWSPDSTMFLSGNTLINTATGEIITRLNHAGRYQGGFTWSADSTRIAEVGAGVLYLWGAE